MLETIANKSRRSPGVAAGRQYSVPVGTDNVRDTRPFVAVSDYTIFTLPWVPVRAKFS